MYLQWNILLLKRKKPPSEKLNVKIVIFQNSNLHYPVSKVTKTIMKMFYYQTWRNHFLLCLLVIMIFVNGCCSTQCRYIYNMHVWGCDWKIDSPIPKIAHYNRTRDVKSRGTFRNMVSCRFPVRISGGYGKINRKPPLKI